MSPGDSHPTGPGDRFAEASAWFARMRGPDAAAARAEFEEWRSQPANAEAYREMEAIWAASGAVSRSASAPLSAVRLRPGLIAAGIATALTIGFLAWNALHRTQTAIAYASERGAIRSFALGDGSRVTLDRASRIDVDLSGAERSVTLLAGRARFAVAKDPSHPFVVRAGEDAVVARGTVFDVALQAGRAQVALIEGAVDLERRERRAPPRLLARLRPGQSALFSANDSAPAIATIRARDWTAGLVSGPDLRLAEVLAQANRYGPVKIVLADPALGDLRVSGGLWTADPRGLAQALAAALDLEVTARPDGTLVLSRKPQVAPAISEGAR
jgi:transmembrane sensor